MPQLIKQLSCAYFFNKNSTLAQIGPVCISVIVKLFDIGNLEKHVIAVWATKQLLSLHEKVVSVMRVCGLMTSTCGLASKGRRSLRSQGPITLAFNR